MIFKVDLKKAYESVSWSFLYDMLKRFGFDEKWRGWMRDSVFSESLLDLVNKGHTEEVTISKGLKEGDPLSPFLL